MSKPPATTALIKSKERRYPKDGELMSTNEYVMAYFAANTEKGKPPHAYKEQLHTALAGFGDQAKLVIRGVDHAKFYTTGKSEESNND